MFLPKGQNLLHATKNYLLLVPNLINSSLFLFGSFLEVLFKYIFKDFLEFLLVYSAQNLIHDRASHSGGVWGGGGGGQHPLPMQPNFVDSPPHNGLTPHPHWAVLLYIKVHSPLHLSGPPHHWVTPSCPILCIK